MLELARLGAAHANTFNAGCFAAFRIGLGPFCSVLHRFGAAVLRSALIEWGRFGVSASIWGRSAVSCIDLGPFC